MRLNGWGLVSAVILAALALLTSCEQFSNMVGLNDGPFEIGIIADTPRPHDTGVEIQSKFEGVQPAGSHQRYDTRCPARNDDFTSGRCTIVVTDVVTGNRAGCIDCTVYTYENNDYRVYLDSRGDLRLQYSSTSFSLSPSGLREERSGRFWYESGGVRYYE